MSRLKFKQKKKLSISSRFILKNYCYYYFERFEMKTIEILKKDINYSNIFYGLQYQGH
jgi:hypothetical protein